MVRVLVNESKSVHCLIIETQIHQCSPPWMQNQTLKNEECSETILLQISFVGIYFYVFTKNLKQDLSLS